VQKSPFHTKRSLKLGFTDNKLLITAVRGSGLWKLAYDIIVAFFQTAWTGTFLCVVCKACDDTEMMVIYERILKVWLLDLAEDHPYASAMPG